MVRKINKPVLIAGLTMALTFFVHIFAGGPELYGPLRASSLSTIEIATFCVVWHFTSMQLFLLAVALFFLAKYPNLALFCFTLVTAIGFAALFIGYGIIDLGSIWLMPQWIAFAVVSALMIWGRWTS